MQIGLISFTPEGKVIEQKTFNPDFEDCISIPIYPYSRAQYKKDLLKQIEEYEEEFEK